MLFFTCPDGNLYAVCRVGGLRAFNTGFIILGTGHDEILGYFECPAAVAVAWRNALTDALRSSHRNRRFPAIDWQGLAMEADLDWAVAHEWPAVLVTSSSAQPVRRKPTDIGPNEL